MKEAVQRILETEKQVRESIERAHADSQTIVRAAEERSRKVEDEVRQKAVHEAQELLERMKREAEEERARQIEKAQGGSVDLVGKKAAEIEVATERVTNLILGIEAAQGELFDGGASR